MPICKDCGSDLIDCGLHNEAKDYKRWVCPLCDAYKAYKTCSMCQRQYGHDAKTDNGICPICSWKLYGKKSRLDNKGPKEIEDD